MKEKVWAQTQTWLSCLFNKYKAETLQDVESGKDANNTNGIKQKSRNSQIKIKKIKTKQNPNTRVYTGEEAGL